MPRRAALTLLCLLMASAAAAQSDGYTGYAPSPYSSYDSSSSGECEKKYEDGSTKKSVVEMVPGSLSFVCRLAAYLMPQVMTCIKEFEVFHDDTTFYMSTTNYEAECDQLFGQYHSDEAYSHTARACGTVDGSSASGQFDYSMYPFEVKPNGGGDLGMTVSLFPNTPLSSCTATYRVASGSSVLGVNTKSLGDFYNTADEECVQPLMETSTTVVELVPDSVSTLCSYAIDAFPSLVTDCIGQFTVYHTATSFFMEPSSPTLDNCMLGDSTMLSGCGKVSGATATGIFADGYGVFDVRANGTEIQMDFMLAESLTLLDSIRACSASFKVVSGDPALGITSA